MFGGAWFHNLCLHTVGEFWYARDTGKILSSAPTRKCHSCDYNGDLFRGGGGRENLPRDGLRMRQGYSNSLRNLVCRIDVSAFAGVMFALVAMFLVPAAVVDHRDRISVDLAKVSHPAAMRAELREDVMEVAITRDGKIYFGLDQIMLASLPDLIRKGISNGAERKVYIRADFRSRYGEVQQVVEAVGAAGIERIGFLVDPLYPPDGRL